jgi:hypothetical protein
LRTLDAVSFKKPRHFAYFAKFRFKISFRQALSVPEPLSFTVVKRFTSAYASSEVARFAGEFRIFSRSLRQLSGLFPGRVFPTKSQQMNTNYRFILRVSAATVLTLSASLFCGCGNSEIQTYRVAKEDTQPPAIDAAHGQAGAGAERPALPHVHSDVPEGWQEVQAEGMRVAAYQITGANGKAAQVAIIPLPGKTNIELQSVNMWRAELGLKPLDSDQLKDAAQPAQVGDAKGILVDMSAETAGPSGINRTIGALAERGNIMWFVKMTGDSTVVGEQKDKFAAFLKSLDFHESSHGQPTQVAANTPPVPSAEKPVSSNTQKLPVGSDEPNFKVPANWTEKAPGAMVQRAFDLTGDDGKAEITISRFPGAAGGMIPNVNRWRGQLGLPPLAAAEVKDAIEMVEIDGKKDSYLVDIKGMNARTGKMARLVALGVPYKGETWFFKLLGDETVVGKEKDAFVKFVVSAY